MDFEILCFKEEGGGVKRSDLRGLWVCLSGHSFSGMEWKFSQVIVA